MVSWMGPYTTIEAMITALFMMGLLALIIGSVAKMNDIRLGGIGGMVVAILLLISREFEFDATSLIVFGAIVALLIYAGTKARRT